MHGSRAGTRARPHVYSSGDARGCPEVEREKCLCEFGAPAVAVCESLSRRSSAARAQHAGAISRAISGGGLGRGGAVLLLLLIGLQMTELGAVSPGVLPPPPRRTRSPAPESRKPQKHHSPGAQDSIRGGPAIAGRAGGARVVWRGTVGRRVRARTLLTCWRARSRCGRAGRTAPAARRRRYAGDARGRGWRRAVAAARQPMARAAVDGRRGRGARQGSCGWH